MLFIWSLFCVAILQLVVLLHMLVAYCQMFLFVIFGSLLFTYFFLSGSLLQLLWGLPCLRSFLQWIRKVNTNSRYPGPILFYLLCSLLRELELLTCEISYEHMVWYSLDAKDYWFILLREFLVAKLFSVEKRIWKEINILVLCISVWGLPFVYDWCFA